MRIDSETLKYQEHRKVLATAERRGCIDAYFRDRYKQLLPVRKRLLEDRHFL